MKNKCESCGRSKSRTFTVVIFLFEGEYNAFSARNELNRLAIISSDVIFTFLFQKYAFLGILWSKFLLKMRL